MSHIKTRRLIALLTATLLVWSQLALAAYACQQPVTADPAAPAARQLAMSADCPMGQVADQGEQRDDQSTPLCKAHCVQQPQSHQTATLDMPAVQLAAFFVLPHFQPDSLQSGTFLRSDSLPSARGSPPLRIQYQVFRI